MTGIYKAAQQALGALLEVDNCTYINDYGDAALDTAYEREKTDAAITTLRAALAEQPAEQESAQDEYNRVVNHAIEQGIEASVFLRCWREGDWSGCAEFGFETNMAA